MCDIMNIDKKQAVLPFVLLIMSLMSVAFFVFIKEIAQKIFILERKVIVL